MAYRGAMFIFEVVVVRVQSFVESRNLMIRADFGEVFSLELRDPKTMHIVIPDPPPLPPEPPGKKGKKKKKPPKKGKKGKKGKEPEPPPEPDILSGQSVLFSSSAELLTQNMKQFPLEVSLWSKEDMLQFIGSAVIPWDPIFLQFLHTIYDCSTCPPVAVRDDYNVFEEGTAKIMAKITLQVKLSYLADKIVTAFRSLSEDPTVKKWLYTGMNSRTTSYMCTLKTTDEEFEENYKKAFAENSKYTKEREFPSPGADKIIYASFKNAPAAEIPLYDSGETYCCKGFGDKAPLDKYTSPETCPDIDFICDYIRNIISSCNDNMRMLTPRPTIRPRIRATDIDKLCYCKETAWPKGDLAERFRRETQGGPCPVCIRELDGKKRPGTEGCPRKTLDITNIRGPCGRHDCRIAREMRVFLENLVEEDNKVINFDDIIGPCGSKECTLVDRIKDFLRHKGPFDHAATKQGLSTQCACVDTMQASLIRKGSCDSICSKDCEQDSSEYCGGKICPHDKAESYHPSECTTPEKSSKSSVPSKSSGPPSKDGKSGTQQVYCVYYFTVEYDHDTNTSKSSGPSSVKTSATSVKTTSGGTSRDTEPLRYCQDDCPIKAEEICSRHICPSQSWPTMFGPSCVNPTCPLRHKPGGPPAPISPADSDVEIYFRDIRNPCCVKSCDVAEKVKGYIVEGLQKKAKSKSCIQELKDPCFCDCVCTFKFSAKTTYCPICGGYECAGDDIKELPDFMKPHPCPVYHKLYNKNYIRVNSPFPEERKVDETPSTKSGKSSGVNKASRAGLMEKKQQEDAKKLTAAIAPGKKKTKKKKSGKYSASATAVNKAPKKAQKYHMDPVPKYMGWNWKAEDVPGMKPRPKWRPGAAHKILVRRYKTIREGIDIIAKKKRALLNKKKKLEMKPTLVVTKQPDGEITVQMEVFRKYSKERLPYQYPYDEKPPLIYTIGKTAEQKAKLQRQRDRKERRETRRKRRLLQSTFRDKCQEICLKAYNQSIGLLPFPNHNNPECPCDTPAVKMPESPIIDSCSCSDSGTISSSDTDNDEWIVEFTPPLATWDAKAKHPPVVHDNESQYNYLDFRVKLLDKQGNPVPRYFKGPDGKQECSDLGGFWGPGHQWLEINKDGFIAPDNRWVPLNFLGPDGQMYLAEEGFFTDSTGKDWKIGVDGYVDSENKWVFYGRKNRPDKGSISTMTYGHARDSKPPVKDAKAVTITPTTSAKSPPHRLSTSTPGKTPAPAPTGTKTDAKVAAAGEPAPKHAPPPFKGKGVAVMSVKTSNYGRLGAQKKYTLHSRQSREERVGNNTERQKQTSEQIKQMNAKAARYQEIMQGLQMYDEMPEIRPPTKTSRACNTQARMVYPYTSSYEPRYYHRRY